MRKLIVCLITSLDGYAAGPGDDVMAMPMVPAFDAYNLERMLAADTVLTGRRTYEGFASHWPAVEDDPAALPADREISRRYGEIELVTVSDTLPAGLGPWRDRTTVLRRADAHAAIAALRAGDGGDILVFGSLTLWNDLLAAGLVDELHLMVGPVVLGAGRPAFAAAPPAALRLLDTRRLPGSDLVLVRYGVGDSAD